MSDHTSSPMKSVPQTRSLVDAYIPILKERHPPNTYWKYIRHLNHFAEEFPLLPLNFELVQEYTQRQTRPHDQLCVIRGFYSWLEEKSKITNPIPARGHLFRQPLPKTPYQGAGVKTKELATEFVDVCQNRGLRPTTIRFYQSILHAYEVDYPELPAQSAPVLAFVGSYKSSEERRHSAYRVLRAFHTWIAEEKHIPSPVTFRAPVRHHREKPALTLEQLNQLLSYPFRQAWLVALLHLLADTGCRVGEAYFLPRTNVLDTTLMIPQEGKTGSREVPLSPKVKAMLLALPEREDGRLFPGASTHYLTQKVGEAFKAAGLPGFGAHSLRHTFATLFKGDLLALKKITGHASWSMVENYSHNGVERAKAAHHDGSPLAQLGQSGHTDTPKAPVTSQVPAATPPTQTVSATRGVDDLLPGYLTDSPETFYVNALVSNYLAELTRIFSEYAKTGKRVDFADAHILVTTAGSIASGTEYPLEEDETPEDWFKKQLRSFWRDMAQESERIGTLARLKAMERRSDTGTSILLDEVKLSDVTWQAN